MRSIPLTTKALLGRKLRGPSKSWRRTTVFALGLALSFAASSSLTTLTPSAASVDVGTTATTIPFPIARTGDTGANAYIRYHTTDGTALAGSDYTAAAGTIVIPAGVSNTQVPVDVFAATGAGASDKNFQLLFDSATGVGPAPEFSTEAAFSTEVTPFGITRADLNGDGRLDLIVANYDSDSVSVLFNTAAPGAASPSFSAQQSFAVGDGPNGVSAADLNGDGRLDLGVANYLGNTVSVLLNTTTPGASAASFTSAQNFATNSQPGSVAIFDANSDGLPDLASANGDSTISLLLNITTLGASTANFVSQQSLAITSPSYSVIATDMNGDGRADLVAANLYGGGASVLFNTTAPGAAAASFTATQGYLSGDGSDFVMSTDVNSDGRPDLVLMHYGLSTITVLLNTIVPGTTTASFSAEQNFATGTTPLWVSSGDLNGDGKPELLSADIAAGSISLFVNTTPAGSSTVSFAARQSVFAGPAPGSVEPADFNADGKLDLVVSNTQSGSVSVLLNTTVVGDAVPDLGNEQTFATSTAPQSVAVTDLNGDGNPDLVVANSSASSVSVLLNTSTPGAGASAFASQQSFATDTSPVSIATADFNGDGRSDLVTANQLGNTVSVLFNTTAAGAATPSFATQQAFATGIAPVSVAVADVNGDDRPDLIVADSGIGTISVFLNTAAPGASTPSFSAGLPFITGAGPRSVAASDVNGDGRPDVIVADSNADMVSVLLNTTAAGAGVPSFALDVSFATEDGPRSIVAGDLNGDGRPDLIAANFSANTISVLLNTTAPGAGSPSFAAQQSFATGNGPVALASTTTDAEGRLYVVVANQTDNSFSVLLNTTAPGSGTVSFFALQTFATQTGPTAITQADLNFDGKPDVVVSNGSSNSVSVRLNTQYQTALAAAAVTGTLHFPDITSDTFSFTAVTNSALSTLQTSNSITVSGLGSGVTVPVSISGGQYSLTPFGGSAGAYTGSVGTAGDGDTVIIQQTSSASFATTTSAILTVGSGSTARSGAFDVTTAAADSTPDAVSFTAASGVEPGSTQTSNSVTVAGINTGSPISISNGAYSLNGAAYTTASGTANLGDSVIVRVVASTNFAANITATLNIGGTQADYSVTTRNANTTPTPFSFPPVTGATPNAVVTSSNILVLGIEAPAAISVVNGLFSINGGAFTDMVGAVVNNGDTVRVQQTASASFSTTTTATLTIDTVSADFTVTTEVADPTPDAFSFTAIGNVDPGTVQTSNTITVAGINTAAAIGVTGGSYSINGAAFVTTPGTVGNGDTVAVRQTASASFATTTTATLTIDTLSAGYAVTTRAADVTPDAFAFSPVSNVPTSSVQTSSAIVVGGIEAPATISVSGGSYRINGGAFITTAGTVNDGDTVVVRQTASASVSTTSTATLTIESVSGGFSVTTEAADTAPDAFSFTAATGVDPGTVQTSNPITVAGINTAAAISATGGTYSINGGAFVSATGTVANGDSVRVRQTASASFVATTTTTLTIDTQSAGYAITTRAAGVTPDAFAFTPVSNAPTGSVQTSNMVVIAGIEAPVAISVTGGSYSLNGAAFVTAAGTVSDGDSVAVRQIASAGFSTTTTAVLTVGGVSGSYAVTTEAVDATPNSFTFTAVSGVDPGSVQTSNSIIVGGINTAVAVSVTGGSYSINGGAYVSAVGTVVNGDSVSLRQTASASFATTTTATLAIGGVSAGFSVATAAAPSINIPPIANAGPDATAAPNTAYTLNGSASSDVDGTIVSYAWAQIDGTPVMLTGANSASPRFTTPNVSATLVFQLTVSDNSGGTASDIVTITVPAPDFQFGNGGGAVNPLWLLAMLLLRRRRAGRPRGA